MKRRGFVELKNPQFIEIAAALLSDEFNLPKYNAMAVAISALHPFILSIFKFFAYFFLSIFYFNTTRVIMLQISELLVNITKHVLQPKHEILTAEEKKVLLRKYKTTSWKKEGNSTCIL